MTGYILEDKNYMLKNSSRKDFGVVERISSKKIKCSTVSFKNLCGKETKFYANADDEEKTFEGFKFYSSIKDLIKDSRNIEDGDFIISVHAHDKHIRSKTVEETGVTRYFTNCISGVKINSQIKLHK